MIDSEDDDRQDPATAAGPSSASSWSGLTDVFGWIIEGIAWLFAGVIRICVWAVAALLESCS